MILCLEQFNCQLCPIFIVSHPVTGSSRSWIRSWKLFLGLRFELEGVVVSCNGSLLMIHLEG